MIDKINITQAAKEIIPKKKAFEWNLLPIKFENDIFYFALPNKDNNNVLNDIGFYTGFKLNVIELPSEMILRKLNEIYPDSDNNEQNSFSSDNSFRETSNIEFVNKIISNAISSFASDIHFESFEKLLRIRYRIDGYLREIDTISKDKSSQIMSRLKIMANLDISEKRRPQDGKISYTHGNSKIDIRLSSIPTIFGEKIVLRLLNRSSVPLDFDQLGLNNHQKEIILKNIKLPYGMILVTGPTGSGKSTTLYTALNYLHSVEKNILTIEDPIEYNISGINQSQVKPDIGYDFAKALRAFLRQDPDIIMVGEIRDKETAEIAIRASLTGHLVFSTLHTNDSASAIMRLIDIGIEPFLIASSLKLIVAQRLVRKLCSCKIKNYNEELNKEVFTKNGCNNCGYTGYKGRTAIFELLEIDDNLTTLINKNITINEIRTKVGLTGQTLYNSGIEKLILGQTTFEEVVRETTN
ncbi:MAG TPA: GspE/PulE family protein [Ignavibacteriaceae bacterium]|nr:GspE/PulE family protein [Ignavibacteriaceae bacterium]